MRTRDEYIAEVFSRRDEYKKEQKKRRKKYAVSGTALALCCALVISIPIYTTQRGKQPPKTNNTEQTAELIRKKTANLMDGIESNEVKKSSLNAQFKNAQMNFSMKLFSEVFKKNNNENVLLSPASVQIALAMTANGANGETLRQMESALGGLPIDALNKGFYSYNAGLPQEEKCNVKFANSIWFRDTADFEVKRDFLQKNADYYGAGAYKSPFNKQTLNEINRWVSDNTNGKINKILEEIDDDDLMYLINTVMFEAEWEKPYIEQACSEEMFTSLSRKQHNVTMMSSTENRYIEDSKGTGFVKNYTGGRYQFVALLPNKDVTLDEYIDYLSNESAEKLMSRWTKPQEAIVHAKLPKFKYDFEMKLNSTLEKMGMTDAFNSRKADFSGIWQSSDGNLYIDTVLHKAHISVAEKGTEAGAATLVTMKAESAPIEEQLVKEVTLDRPFVYLIVDSQSGLPLFMGTVTDIN